jgi:hypothetical protein
MALEDLTNERLRAIAYANNVEVTTSMNKDELVTALNEAGVTEDTTAPAGQVSGFQQGVYYPPIPVTAKQFSELLDHPETPAQFQAAPSQEQLNPHLFGPQGRLNY